MDVNSLIAGLLGQADPAMAATTPRLTKNARDLPKQQRGKAKEAQKGLPAEVESPTPDAPLPPEIEALITSMIAGGSGAQPGMAELQQLLTSQAGLPITPEMVAPQTTGTAYPANFSPESQMAKLLAMLGAGPDPETPDDDTPYVDDEDPGDHEYR